MAHDWILDVLSDLRSFASQNGLGVTERQIGQALAAASEELMAGGGIAQGTANIGHVGKLPGSLARSRNS